MGPIVRGTWPFTSNPKPILEWSQGRNRAQASSANAGLGLVTQDPPNSGPYIPWVSINGVIGVTVFGSGIETAGSADNGPHYGDGPLDRSGSAPREGNHGDGGGSRETIQRGGPDNEPPANDPKDFHGIPYTSGVEDAAEGGAIVGGITGAVEGGIEGAAAVGLFLGPGGAFLGGFGGAVTGGFFGALGTAELSVGTQVLVNFINGHR